MEHQKWVKPPHAKAIPFCEDAYNSWFTTSDPLQLLTQDTLAPTLYKDIRTYDVAMSVRAALRNLSLRNPLDDPLPLALWPGITMKWHARSGRYQGSYALRRSFWLGGGEQAKLLCAQQAASY